MTDTPRTVPGLTEFDYLTHEIETILGVVQSGVENLNTDQELFPKKVFELRLLEANLKVLEWQTILQEIVNYKNATNSIDSFQYKIDQRLTVACQWFQGFSAALKPIERLKRYVRVNILQRLLNAIERSKITFTKEYQRVIARSHPQIDEVKGYAPGFAPEKLVRSNAPELLVKIESYYFCKDEWIAECQIKISGSSKCKVGDKLLIRAIDLFADFEVFCLKPFAIRQYKPIYGLGTVRKATELRQMFKGLNVPKIATPFCTEIIAPDRSVWQAVLDGYGRKKFIKWMCEVLPDGLSRSPRILTITA